MKIKTILNYDDVILDCSAADLGVYTKVIQTARKVTYDYKESVWCYQPERANMPEIQVLLSEIKEPEAVEPSKEPNDE